jgi:hypothetical protein
MLSINLSHWSRHQEQFNCEYFLTNIKIYVSKDKLYKHGIAYHFSPNFNLKFNLALKKA